MLKPGTELDLLITRRVMGLVKGDYRRLSKTERMWYHIIEGVPLRGEPFRYQTDDKKSANVDHQWYPFCPSTRIEDAWRVVERMDKLGFDLSLFKQRSCESGKWVGPWGAYFHERPIQIGDDGCCGHGAAPLAICLAALARMDWEAVRASH